jgi:LDH2 family malate/lactate/ureidoglycolate dehydrogenase
MGLPRKDAEESAHILVLSDLRGVDTHGVARLFYYVWKLREGMINTHPEIRIVRETPSTARIDGDNGMGTVVGKFGMEKTLEMAEKAGLGMVTVRDSNHYGIAGYYSMMALEKDMIGLSLTNAVCLVLPTFARAPGFGTNPISVAVPAGRAGPWVLDMATSTISMGRVEEALRRDTLLKPGWATDREGTDTADPAQVLGAGYLYPLGGKRENGGHKGYGLGVLVDILSAVLSGADFGIRQEGLTTLGTRPSNVGHFFGAVKVSNFMDIEIFKERMDTMIQDFRSLPRAEGEERIYTHGEIEFEHEEDRRKNGIPLNPNVVTTLESIAEETGVPFPAPA